MTIRGDSLEIVCKSVLLLRGGGDASELVPNIGGLEGFKTARSPCVFSEGACVAGMHISGSSELSYIRALDSLVALLGCDSEQSKMGLTVKTPSGDGVAFTHSLISCNLGLFSLVPECELTVRRLLP